MFKALSIWVKRYQLYFINSPSWLIIFVAYDEFDIDGHNKICGFFGFNDKLLLSRMTKIISHRGPDQFGYYVDDKISFGHRRLSIIDLISFLQSL